MFRSRHSSLFQAIAAALPSPATPSAPAGELEDVDFYAVDIESELKKRKMEESGHRNGGGEAYDSDEEDGAQGGAQRVQCAQQ